MSFILDALKKSESDRQRQSGPALFEVRVASPKTQLPLWALAVGALLLVNIVIVGWLLSRRSTHAQSLAAVPPAATSTAVAPAAPEPAAAAPAVPQPYGTAAGSYRPQANSGEPTLGNVNMTGAAVASTPAPTATQAAAPAATTAPASGQMSTATPAPTSAAPSGAVGTQLPPGPATAATGAPSAEDSGASEAANPDDYTPAKEGGSSPLFKGHVRRSTEGGYPLYQDAAVAPGANLPQLRLDLHVYAGRPEDRFALINMHRVHEGDALPEGVRVESINPEGVVLSHNGSKFLLPRD
ncbi:MAG: general secretion pathway protein GspB [Sinobacteraceae bacterium]|nr:general secretion pathway protein GspB [Nevskiaceae bacterium]